MIRGGRQTPATVLAVWIAGTVVPAAGQQIVEVSGEVVCAECKITMDTVVSIGGLDGPGLHLVSRDTRIAVDQRGRLLLHAFRPIIGVFDSTGTFIREIGGTGQGPGEYFGIAHVNVGPRFIHVFEPRRGRTLLDADHRFVRLDPFPGYAIWSAVTPSGAVVFGGDLQTPESAGHRLHLLHANGDFRSYGWDGSVYRGRTGRFYSVAANDSVAWLVSGRSGEMEEWVLLPEPRLSRTVHRSVEEFEREKPPPLRAGYKFPSAYNGGTRLDEHGLWLLWSTPDPGWKVRTNDPEVSGKWDRELPLQAIEDGVLDLINPETGLTLARYRSDLPFHHFVYGSDMVVAYEETQAGVPWLHLLRPRVEGGTRP